MRINLYGGPGSGKSTVSTGLFSALKKRHFSIELVSEYVKSWAIQKREVIGFDQVYLMGKQLNYEYRFLSNGIEHIITDSPVLLSACYTRSYFDELGISDAMEEIILSYEREHPAINIFLNRQDKPYDTRARYQTKAEAILIDGIIRDTLDRLHLPFTEFNFSEEDAILQFIMIKLQQNDA